jgi:hypothetical protein
MVQPYQGPKHKVFGPTRKLKKTLARLRTSG